MRLLDEIVSGIQKTEKVICIKVDGKTLDQMLMEDYASDSPLIEAPDPANDKFFYSIYGVTIILDQKTEGYEVIDKKHTLLEQILKAYGVPVELWEKATPELEKMFDIYLETQTDKIINGEGKGTPKGIFQGK